MSDGQIFSQHLTALHAITHAQAKQVAALDVQRAAARVLQARWCSEEVVGDAMCRALGTPIGVCSGSTFDCTLVQKIPQSICDTNCFVPVIVDRNVVIVFSTQSSLGPVEARLTAIFACAVHVCVSVETALRPLIAAVYAAAQRGEVVLPGSASAPKGAPYAQVLRPAPTTAPRELTNLFQSLSGSMGKLRAAARVVNAPPPATPPAIEPPLDEPVPVNRPPAPVDDDDLAADFAAQLLLQSAPAQSDDVALSLDVGDESLDIDVDAGDEDEEPASEQTSNEHDELVFDAESDADAHVASGDDEGELVGLEPDDGAAADPAMDESLDDEALAGIESALDALDDDDLAEDEQQGDAGHDDDQYDDDDQLVIGDDRADKEHAAALADDDQLVIGDDRADKEHAAALADDDQLLIGDDRADKEHAAALADDDALYAEERVGGDAHDGDDDAPNDDEIVPDSEARLLPPMPLPDRAEPEPVATILVVEDDPEIRKLVAMAVRGPNRRVVDVPDGAQAFEFLRQHKPHAVVLDAMLPGIHGFEICRAIKHSPAYQSTAVFLVSALYRGLEHLRTVHEEFGADGYLEKPFRIHVLRTMINNALGERTAKREPDAAQDARTQEFRKLVAEHKATGDIDAALRCVDEWLALDPFSAAPNLERGALLSLAGSPHEALHAFELAATFECENFEANMGLAMAYDELGFKRRAAGTWQRVRDLAPTDAIRRNIEKHLELLR